jgi:hypothetical protein
MKESKNKDIEIPEGTGIKIGAIKDPTTRTSFALSEDAIKELSILAEKTGSQKEAFDFIDISLTALEEMALDFSAKANEDPKERIRKTYVISKKTLNNIKRGAKECGIKRDLFVERMVTFGNRVYEIMVEKSRNDWLEKQKKAQKLLNELKVHMLSKEQELKQILDGDDPILEAFGEVFMLAEDGVNKINRLLEDNEPIAEYFGIID